MIMYISKPVPWYPMKISSSKIEKVPRDIRGEKLGNQHISRLYTKNTNELDLANDCSWGFNWNKSLVNMKSIIFSNDYPYIYIY